MRNQIIQTVLTTITLIYLWIPTNAQKTKTYKAWMHTINDSPDMAGLLYHVTDSSVILSISSDPLTLKEIPVKQISILKIRSEEQVKTSMAIGFLTGLGVGITLGIASTRYGNPLGPALTGGFSLAALGTLAGGLVGSSKSTVPIFGRDANYRHFRGQLQEYSAKH